MWTVICQHIGEPRRKGYIFRNTQFSKTEWGRNRKYEQTDWKYEQEWNWIINLKTPIEGKSKSSGFPDEFY